MRNHRGNWHCLRVWCPCPRLIRWAILSLPNLCSSWETHCHLLGAGEAPALGPRSHSIRHLAWLLTLSMLSIPLTCPMRMTTSASSLLLLHLCLPSSSCWCHAQEVAISWTKRWTSSDASPHAQEVHSSLIFVLSVRLTFVVSRTDTWLIRINRVSTANDER